MPRDLVSPRGALVFAPSPTGGIPEYAHYQAEELAARGWEVTFLCTRHFQETRSAVSYQSLPRLLAALPGGLLGRFWGSAATVINYYILALVVVVRRPTFVLLEANTEYYAPLWAWPHLLLKWLGVIYVANFHDPVRQPTRGPRWLHRLAVHLSGTVLSGGLIHGPPPPSTYIPKGFAFREVPHGMFGPKASHGTMPNIRRDLGISKQNCLLLSFGHIADRKNIDLLIKALPKIPDAVLLVAGEASSRKDRPPEYYRSLAARLGLAERVIVIDRYIADEDVAGFFAAADVIALTYRGDFVSQSGVLQIAANWDKPILASSGPGPLQRTVTENCLGKFIAPDSVEAIVEGLAELRGSRADFASAMATYRETASWASNVDSLLDLVESCA